MLRKHVSNRTFAISAFILLILLIHVTEGFNLRTQVVLPGNRFGVIKGHISPKDIKNHLNLIE